MNKTFYVVMCDYAMTDSDGNVASDVHASGVFLTKKDAKAALREVSQDIREYAREHDSWFVFADNGVIFDAGEKDCYKNEHARFYIQRVDQECDGPNVIANDILSEIEKLKNATLERYRGSITRSAYEIDMDHVYAMVKSILATPRVTEPHVKIGEHVKDKWGREFIILSYEYRNDGKGQTETIRVMHAEDEGSTVFAVRPYTLKEFREEFPDATPNNNEEE